MSESQPQYAGFWIRTFAAIIDSILLALVLAPIMVAIYGPEQLQAMAHAGHGGGMVAVLFNYLVPAIVIIVFWVYRSATPGKTLFRLEIVDAKTGAQPSTGQFIGRYLGYYVSIIPLLRGIIWVAVDKRKQGFHDKLAGTVVIRKVRNLEQYTDSADTTVMR